MIDRIYLSPHLDDGALSCGGQISRAVRGGERVLVATLFAAPEPAGPLSELATMLHRGWGLPDGRVIAIRRDEDRKACRALGAEPLHLELPEAPYRRHSESGEPLYAGAKALFGSVADGDEGTRAALRASLEELPPARRVIAPLAVGGHVDHVLVRGAAERCFGSALEHYEDFPYVATSWRALSRVLRPRRAWASRVIALDEEDVATRCAAIACYRSQLRPLFKTARRMERMVRRQVARTGGERLWYRV